MNKQNKKIAQEKRRIEREKAEKKAKVVNLLKFWVPVVAVVVVVIVLIWAVATSGGSSSKSTDGTEAASQTTESQTSETQSSDSQTEAATLNTEADTVAENGDKVNIDYTGYMGGEKFEGGSTDGQGTDLVLGSGSYIDGFEDGVVGHKVGETFDLNLKFPDNYKTNTELAGKDVTFEVTLNGVYK